MNLKFTGSSSVLAPTVEWKNSYVYLVSQAFKSAKIYIMAAPLLTSNVLKLHPTQVKSQDLIISILHFRCDDWLKHSRNNGSVHKLIITKGKFKVNEVNEVNEEKVYSIRTNVNVGRRIILLMYKFFLLLSGKISRRVTTSRQIENYRMFFELNAAKTFFIIILDTKLRMSTPFIENILRRKSALEIKQKFKRDSRIKVIDYAELNIYQKHFSEDLLHLNCEGNLILAQEIISVVIAIIKKNKKKAT